MLHISLMFLVYVNSEAVPINDFGNKSTQILNENAFNGIGSNSSQFCLSDACSRETERVLYSLDQSIDPCDDFYTFACGKLIDNTELGEEKSFESEFTKVSSEVAEQVKALLNDDIQPNDTKPLRLAKMFMKTCMDEVTLNKNGIKPMIETLEKYGGWPVLKGDAWNEKKWDWLDMRKQIADDGIGEFILECHVEVRPENSTQRILTLNRAEFGLKQSLLVEGLANLSVLKYVSLMIETAKMFGADDTNATKLELINAVQFEVELAQNSLTETELHNITTINNQLTIKQIQEKYPYMIWLDYFNGCARNLVHVDENEVVIVQDLEFLEELDNHLKATPKRTIANYFAWRIVLFGSNLLNDGLNGIFKGSNEINSDTRLEKCIKSTKQNLPISVAAMYVRKHSDAKSKQTATAIAESIKTAFINNLKEVSWMDDKSRSAAIAKAEAIHLHIAYPDELMDDRKLEEYYDGLEIDPNSLLHNVMRIRRFTWDKPLSKLREPVNKTDWETHSNPTKVGASYSPDENSILLPAASLQGSFFSNDRPSYMNFGGLGWFIAHELTHGFDAIGREYDPNGNLVDWWDEETVKMVTSKTNCFVDQYSNYEHPRLKIKMDGARSLDENIADNGGVKGMYAAYQNFIQKNGQDLPLPGLNYTSNQLLWISSARVWCSVAWPIYDVIFYKTEVHAPDRFRVVGTFSNMQSFSNDFNCSPGSRMNPVGKCQIW